MPRGHRVRKPGKPYFRSKFEESVWDKAIGEKLTLDFEPKDAIMNYSISFRYQPDFRLPNGIVVETKGVLDAWDRRKMIAVRKHNPGIDIRFVFQDANKKLSRGSKTTYWMWAERNGFQWACPNIPVEWFRESTAN